MVLRKVELKGPARSSGYEKNIRSGYISDEGGGNWRVDDSRNIGTLTVHPPLNRKRGKLLMRKGV